MKKPKILVVDDQKNVLEVLKAIVENEGFEAILARNGYEALEELNANPVDIVITDINMPEMDGFALLQLIRKRFPALPVIVMTGYYDIYTKEEALAKGATAFLHKPFRAQEVLELISKELAVTYET